VGDFPATLPLESPQADLPLCIHVGGRSAEVGQAGLALCRSRPHEVFRGFLPALGCPGDTGRRWLTAAHGLDSAGALALVLGRLQAACRVGRGVVLAVPDYLSPEQVERARALAAQARLPVVGSLPASLACALAAYAEQAWFGTAVVIDVDDHALSVSIVQDANGQAHLLSTAARPHLGLHAWKARLLNALADCCILQSRRDPRDSAVAEQALYDQLDGILDDCRHGRLVNVAFRTEHWYQNLVLQPEEVSAFCATLVRQILAEVACVFRASWPKGPPRMFLLTAAAGLLPGLVPALQDQVGALERLAGEAAGDGGEEDFGAGLLAEGYAGEPEVVMVLSPEAAARGAHAVADHFLRGDAAERHLDGVAPLPLPQPLEAGPARLQLQGQDYYLRERSFTLGRLADCDLAFDRSRHANVSPRHCEILYDPEGYQLRDYSREGTWVNDRPVTEPVMLRPGDWIRLGPDGPVLRFLGQAEAVGGRQWAVGS
jgi:hypothetical protein